MNLPESPPKKARIKAPTPQCVPAYVTDIVSYVHLDGSNIFVVRFVLAKKQDRTGFLKDLQDAVLDKNPVVVKACLYGGYNHLDSRGQTMMYSSGQVRLHQKVFLMIPDKKDCNED